MNDNEQPKIIRLDTSVNIDKEKPETTAEINYRLQERFNVEKEINESLNSLGELKKFADDIEALSHQLAEKKRAKCQLEVALLILAKSKMKYQDYVNNIVTKTGIGIDDAMLENINRSIEIYDVNTKIYANRIKLIDQEITELADKIVLL